MADIPNTKPSNPKRIVWVTGIMCVACCAIPFIGIAVGSTALAAFSFYSEGVAIAIAVTGMALLAYIFISRRKAPSCDLGCGCRPNADKDLPSKEG